jgi:hypothetical protein
LPINSGVDRVHHLAGELLMVGLLLFGLSLCHTGSSANRAACPVKHMVITLDIAKQLLGYSDVVCSTKRAAGFRRAPPWTVYSAIPKTKGLPPVEVWMDKASELVDFVSFGGWHGHFEGAADEDENILRAFHVARDILKGRLHVIDQFTRNGKEVGSDLQKRGEPLPCRLRNADYAERLVFGKLPERLTLPSAS